MISVKNQFFTVSYHLTFARARLRVEKLYKAPSRMKEI